MTKQVDHIPIRRWLSFSNLWWHQGHFLQVLFLQELFLQACLSKVGMCQGLWFLHHHWLLNLFKLEDRDQRQGTHHKCGMPLSVNRPHCPFFVSSQRHMPCQVLFVLPVPLSARLLAWIVDLLRVQKVTREDLRWFTHHCLSRCI